MSNLELFVRAIVKSLGILGGSALFGLALLALVWLIWAWTHAHKGE